MVEQVVAQLKDGHVGCLIWPGWMDHYGYGGVRWDGKNRRAHRVVFEQVRGPIPDGLTLDHTCWNPPCVNPAHLNPCSASENLRNQPKAFKPACVNGHLFTPENTYFKTKNGHRSCRACNRAAVARYTARKKESV